MRGALPILLLIVIAPAGCRPGNETGVALLEPPGRGARAHIDGNTAILVNGRRVTPVGRVLRTQSYAWGLALSPDESSAALLGADGSKSSTCASRTASAAIRSTSPPRGRRGVRHGLVHGRRLLARRQRILLRQRERRADQRARRGHPGRSSRASTSTTGSYEDSFIGDFVLSRDGTPSVRRRSVQLPHGGDRRGGRPRTQSVRVGRNPFAIALSPDESWRGSRTSACSSIRSCRA